MTRRLTITNPQHFDVYWHAYLQAQRPQGESFEERRKDARIKKTLEAISFCPDANTPAVRKLVLDGFGGSLHLEQPEHARLCKYVTETAGWNPLLMDVVVDALDALEAADKVD